MLPQANPGEINSSGEVLGTGGVAISDVQLFQSHNIYQVQFDTLLLKIFRLVSDRENFYDTFFYLLKT